MTNLREMAEADLSVTLEDSVSGFGLPIELISPDGDVDSVTGQVIYDTLKIDPNTGAPIVVHNPVAVVRLSSLTRIPLPTEKLRWAIRIPLQPFLTADLVTFLMEDVSQDGSSIGFIRFYLTRPRQQS